MQRFVCLMIAGVIASTSLVYAAPKARLSCPSVPEWKDVIQVDTKNPIHPLLGFGASLTDSSVAVLNTLSSQEKHEALQGLFAKGRGLGLDVLRVPVGSSDFTRPSKGFYTYQDQPTQYDSSMDEDLFLVLKQIVKINPDIKILLSPWSAPAWMKLNGALTGAVGPNRLDPKYYQEFAKYLVEVVKDYRARGLNVYGLTLQNEPAFDWAAYPSMGMSAAEQALIIRDYLGPMLEKEKLSVRIYGLDHNWDLEHYIDEVMRLTGVSKYLAGFAFHCYGGSVEAIGRVKRKYPTLEVIQTECTGFGPPSHGDFSWWVDNQVLYSSSLGSSMNLAWNIALDENGGPYNKAYCSNCRGLLTVNSLTKKVTVNPEALALGLGSERLKKGARYLASWSEDSALTHMAYQNGDKSLAIVVKNNSDKERELMVIGKQCKTQKLKIPAWMSMATEFQD